MRDERRRNVLPPPRSRAGGREVNVGAEGTPKLRHVRRAAVRGRGTHKDPRSGGGCG